MKRGGSEQEPRKGKGSKRGETSKPDARPYNAVQRAEEITRLIDAAIDIYELDTGNKLNPNEVSPERAKEIIANAGKNKPQD